MMTIILLLVGSGLMRLGTVGMAIAEQNGLKDSIAPKEGIDNPEEASQLLAVLRQRSDELDALELELLDKEKALAASELVIRQNLEKLEETEKRLSQTIAAVDSASTDDVDALTAVYESMKPKTAAPLFEQMTPDFAAGFLSRMRPDAAAGILAGLTAEHGYAVSVVMAGRNATAPTN